MMREPRPRPSARRTHKFLLIESVIAMTDRRFLSAAIATLAIGSAHFAKAESLFSSVRSTYLAELEQTIMPVFTVRCAMEEGMFLIIQPIGERRGHFYELSWKNRTRGDPEIFNTGDVFFGLREPVSPWIMLGGPGAWRIRNAMAKRMAKLPFQLFLPETFDRIIEANPTTKCDTSDPG